MSVINDSLAMLCMNISFFRFGSDPSRYVLRLGDYHTEERDDFERTLSPERIVIHGKYHSQGWEYDIALLKLKGTDGNCVAFNPHTNAVCLPPQSNRRGKRPIACVITGWGITGTANSNIFKEIQYIYDD